MNENIRRASGFTLIGALAFIAPMFETAAGLPFALVALLSVVITSGPVFNLLARPGDYDAGRLRGLFGFSLSAAVLGTLAGAGEMPMAVFTGTIFLVALGNLGAVISQTIIKRINPTFGYIGGALIGGILGVLIPMWTFKITTFAAPVVVTLTLSGALLAALIHSMLFSRDEPPVIFSVGLLLWLLTAVGIDADLVAISVAVLITFTLGTLAYYFDAASVEGMIAGVLLGLLAIVLGGYNWFAVLFAFFAIGGISSKFRYERKLQHGVAEKNQGARGGENVLANASVGMGALFFYSLTEAGAISGDALLYVFAFAGAIATALSDTLASEIGGSYGRTRLITTLKPVEPGTDGGITWQGMLAGIVGATIIAGLAYYTFPAVASWEALVIVTAGVAGMVIDSLLGATVEGQVLGNGSVNFLATFSGAIIAAILVVAVGTAELPPLPALDN